jgi:hypothetical protein
MSEMIKLQTNTQKDLIGIIKEKKFDPQGDYIRVGDDEWWLSFPGAWRVLPRKTGKSSDELRLISMHKGKKFNGTTEEYLPWKSEFIEHIHKAHITPVQKLTCLKERLDMTVPFLKNLYEMATYTDDNYMDIIVRLESAFGGKDRLLSLLVSKLLNGRAIKSNDLENCRENLFRLKCFKNHCRAEGLLDNYNTSIAFMLIRKAMLSNKSERTYYYSQKEMHCWSEGPDGIIQHLDKRIEILSQSEDQDLLDLSCFGKPQDSFKKHTFTSKSKPDSIPEEVENYETDFPDRVDSSSDPNPSVESSDDEDAEPEEIEQALEMKVALAMYTKNTFVPPVCDIHKATGGVEQRHMIVMCELYRKMSPIEKLESIRKQQRCFNCFSTKHGAPQCDKIDKKTGERARCHECMGRHHSSLHESFQTSRPNSKS